MVFSTMGADPSRPLMMTINVSFIMTCFPQIVIQNGVRMLCEKNGKRDGDTE